MLRAALGLLALLIVAWFGLNVRDYELRARGGHETAHAGQDHNAAKATADLKDAQLLNPDPEPERVRAYLLVVTNRRHRAVLALDRLVRTQPQNLELWYELFQDSNGHEDAIAQRAADQIQRLDPLVEQRP